MIEVSRVERLRREGKRREALKALFAVKEEVATG